MDFFTINNEPVNPVNITIRRLNKFIRQFAEICAKIMCKVLRNSIPVMGSLSFYHKLSPRSFPHMSS